MSRSRRALAAGLLLLVALPAPAGAGERPGSFAALAAELDAIRASHGVAAYALTVAGPDGSLRTAASGLADRATERPMTPGTPVRIGSITKTFNALAALMLVEEGRLSLDTPLRALAPDAPLDNPWADTDPVRIVHLLEHSSGLLDLTRAEFDHNRPFPGLEAALAFRPGARRVQWPPGLHSVYSNANAGLAGLALERAAGRPYAALITERLLVPLGITTAGLSDDAQPPPGLATGYDRDGVTPIPYWHMIFPPLGAIDATPREMGALLKLLLGHGAIDGRRLLAPGSIDRMERPGSTLGARAGLRYGYGPGLDQFVHRGFRFFGHNGDGDGYLSQMAYSREAGRGYFLVINAFDHAALDAMKRAVQDWLIAGVPAPPVPPPAGLTAERTARIQGRYRAVTRRFPWQDDPAESGDVIEILVEDGTLLTVTDGGRRPLIPVTGHRFRREGQPLATLAIVEHAGERYLQGDMGTYRQVAGGGGQRSAVSCQLPAASCQPGQNQK